MASIMASIFRFRTRNPMRDAETDRLRAERLRTLVDQIAEEIASERRGLENRYRAAVDDAGFAAEALDNGELSGGAGGRVDELTQAILNCERRLAELSQQSEHMQEIQRHVSALETAQENASAR